MINVNHKQTAPKARQFPALGDGAHEIIILLYIWTINYNYYPFWAIIIIIDQNLNFLKFPKKICKKNINIIIIYYPLNMIIIDYYPI
jgi:hypothetical protein